MTPHYDLIPFLILLALLAYVGIVIWRAKPGEPIAPTPPKWVSWYLPPRRHAPMEYLADTPDGNGFMYVRNIEHAKRFNTEAEALAPTPIYDGSVRIEARTGVHKVRG